MKAGFREKNGIMKSCETRILKNIISPDEVDIPLLQTQSDTNHSMRQISNKEKISRFLIRVISICSAMRKSYSRSSWFGSRTGIWLVFHHGNTQWPLYAMQLPYSNTCSNSNVTKKKTSKRVATQSKSARDKTRAFSQNVISWWCMSLLIIWIIQNELGTGYPSLNHGRTRSWKHTDDY